MEHAPDFCRHITPTHTILDVFSRYIANETGNNISDHILLDFSLQHQSTPCTVVHFARKSV